MQAEEIYSVDGLPPEWGGVVAKFVEDHAARNESNDGRGEQYLKALQAAKSGGQFITQAKQYSLALWQWSTKSAPTEILDWVFGNVKSGIEYDTTLRLHYLLFRREQMAWWSVRRKLPQTKKNIHKNAQRLKGSVVPLLVAMEIDDIQLFKHMVTEKRQNRHNKLPYEPGFFVAAYWMAWFLWEGDYGATIQNFKKRLEYKVSERTLRRVIKRLGLTMQKQTAKSATILPGLKKGN